MPAAPSVMNSQPSTCILWSELQTAFWFIVIAHSHCSVRSAYHIWLGLVASDYAYVECVDQRMYSARAQDGPQEMERSLATAKHVAWPTCGWLLLSFFPFPVDYPEHEHCSPPSVAFFSPSSLSQFPQRLICPSALVPPVPCRVGTLTLGPLSNYVLRLRL